MRLVRGVTGKTLVSALKGKRFAAYPFQWVERDGALFNIYLFKSADEGNEFLETTGRIYGD